MTQVAIIGAGLAGLTLARELVQAGLSVQVFDKGRVPAGRMSTRERDGGTFDHGAQYFTAREPDFQREVEAWVARGLAAEWRGRFGTLTRGSVVPKHDGPARYVGVPGMSAVARALASGLDVRSGVKVARARREQTGWALTAETGEALGHFERVAVAVPAPQAALLLEDTPELAARAAAVVMEPCWAAMVRFEAPVALPLDGVFVHDSPLTWAARDSAKPGRAPGEHWVLHASPVFSREHLETLPGDMAPRLVEAFARALGGALPPGEAVAHRWRYAQAEPPLSEGALWDAARGVGVCGDWCAGSRVEGAFLSGRALAHRLLTRP